MDSCCFCIPLRTGSLVIGYLNLIANIIITVIAILLLSSGIVIKNSDFDDGDAGDAGAVVIEVSAVFLIFMVISLAFTIVLLIGLHKERPGHVKAYLIYGLVFLIINIILFIVGVSAPNAGRIIVGKIIEILLSAYFLLVIRSHYVRMLDSNYNSA